MDFQLSGILIAALFSAWFAGSETVFLSYDKARFQAWLLRGVKGTRSVDFLSKKPERFLITTLTGNNLCNVLYSSLFALWFNKYGFSEQFILIAAPLFLLVFGEAAPKVMANQLADRSILVVGRALYIMRIAFLPVVSLVEAYLGFLQRRLGLTEKAMDHMLSRSDITGTLHEAGKCGVLPATESKMLQRFIGMTERRVRDIMTPRISVVALPLDTPVSKARRIILESGFTRLPCYEDEIDNIAGVLVARDLLKNPVHLIEVLRPLPLVPESLPLVNLLTWMRKNRSSLAGVIDEHGGFEGIVSIDDLAEELVGLIRDEYDADDRECIRLSESTWLVNGQTRLSLLEQRLGFKPLKSKAASLGGAIVNIEGGIPEVGAEFDLPAVRLRVVSADKRGVRLVRLTVKSPADNETKALFTAVKMIY